MGGKVSQPAPPDFAALAQSSSEAAQLNRQTSVEQLDWAKQQYADMAPVTKAYLQQQVDSSAAQTKNAADAQAMYTSTYKPIESQFAQTAQDYNSPARAAERAGAAEADVSSAFGQQRQAALSNLESFGIDPSQTRFGALDLGTRISQAAATATAGTQSRQQTEATGLALQGEAINIGRGYPGAVAQAYNSATQAGQSGINSGLNTSQTYGNLMGTPVQYGQLQNQSLGVGAQVANSQANYGIGVAQANAQQAAGLYQGIGSLVGAGIGVAAL
jgi:hypothetical protein